MLRRLGSALALVAVLGLLLFAPPAPATDISITVANVAKGSSAIITVGTAGETVTAGMGVYIKSSDAKMYKALAAGTAEQATFAGISLHGSLAGQPIAYQTSGTITIGGTAVVGTVYVVSATAGGVAPVADLVSTNKVTIIGYGASATTITLAPTVTGVAVP